jgi:hypothetical protein
VRAGTDARNQRQEVIGVVVLRQIDAAKIVVERFILYRSDKKATHDEPQIAYQCKNSFGKPLENVSLLRE